MKNIKELMMVSKKGDFYSSQKLMSEFGLNKNELKIIMEEMGFEPARKTITVDGDKKRVRGYVCVVESEVFNEFKEYETTYDVEEEPMEEEFKLEQYTYNQMISMSDLMKKLLIGEIRLHYEELLEYYQFAKEEVFNDFKYLNDFVNQF